jgi:hypothetical protein
MLSTPFRRLKTASVHQKQPPAKIARFISLTFRVQS